MLVTLAEDRGSAPDMEPHFAFCFEGVAADSIRETGAPLSILSPARFSRPLRWVAARRQLRSLISREKIDCLVVHSPWALALFGSVAHKKATPLVLWLHNGATKHWIDRLASRVAVNLVIANSRFTAMTVPTMFRDVPVQTILCPISVSLPADRSGTRIRVRRNLRASENAVVILQVSRMERWKGHDLLIRALASIKDDWRWTCWLAGGAQRPAEREYESELKRLVSEKHLENRVQFLGSWADVPELLVAADLFCQPNREPEPFGMSIVEAMAAALPVITMNMGGASETVTSECGRLVNPEDEAGLASALRQLVDDGVLRNRLGDAGPARATLLCDPARQIAVLSQVLRGVVRSGDPRG